MGFLAENHQILLNMFQPEKKLLKNNREPLGSQEGQRIRAEGHTARSNTQNILQTLQ